MDKNKKNYGKNYKEETATELSENIKKQNLNKNRYATSQSLGQEAANEMGVDMATGKNYQQYGANQENKQNNKYQQEVSEELGTNKMKKGYKYGNPKEKS